MKKFFDRIDRACERWGDELNPILVKETRQALKSRQFVATFSVLLIGSLGWTIIGSLIGMPEIYTTPSAPRMLTGYFLVLALPMLLVVPLAAYRSLEAEIDDGTLELLSITTLSPWQIVLGKLFGACLQMVLYFVVLFPCVAYAYSLRGVDLPTTLLIMATLMVVAVSLTIVGLFFAPLIRNRTGRIVTLLAVMVLVLIAIWSVSIMIVEVLNDARGLDVERLQFFGVAGLAIAVSAGWLLLTVTAAQLTPESENRSTPIRLGLLGVTATVTGLMVCAQRMFDDGDRMDEFVVIGSFGLLALWTFAGGMMVAESPSITPRIRRELPATLLARLSLTWLTPGPTTGLVFVVLHLVAINLILRGVIWQAIQAGTLRTGGGQIVKDVAITYSAYLIIFLVGARWIIAGLRRKNTVRVEVGLAALAAVAVFAAVVPFSIAKHLNDYRDFPYDGFQITNWFWTLAEISNGAALPRIRSTVVATAFGAFVLTVLAEPKLVFARRIATPKRVLEARRQLAAAGSQASADALN